MKEIKYGMLVKGMEAKMEWGVGPLVEGRNKRQTAGRGEEDSFVQEMLRQ